MVEPGAEPMRRLAVIDRTQPDRGPRFLAHSWRVLGALSREPASGCGIRRHKLAIRDARHRPVPEQWYRRPLRRGFAAGAAFRKSHDRISLAPAVRWCPGAASR